MQAEVVKLQKEMSAQQQRHAEAIESERLKHKQEMEVLQDRHRNQIQEEERRKSDRQREQKEHEEYLNTTHGQTLAQVQLELSERVRECGELKNFRDKLSAELVEGSTHHTHKHKHRQNK